MGNPASTARRRGLADATAGRVTPLLVALLLLAAPGAATDYYVRSTGDDANLGTTPALAWATLQHALDLMQPGDTTYVGAGTYVGGVDSVRDGRAKAPISLVADTGGAQTGDAGTVLLRHTGDLIDLTHDHHVVRGFHLDSRADAIEVTRATGIVLDQLTVVSAGDDGIDFDRASGVVTDTRIERARYSGIEASGSGIVEVKTSTVVRVDGNAFDVRRAQLELQSVSVLRAGQAGVYARGPGPLRVTDARVENAGGSGMVLRALEAQVGDTTITGAQGNGIAAQSEVTLEMTASAIRSSGGRGIAFRGRTLRLRDTNIEDSQREAVWAKGQGTVTMERSTLRGSGRNGATLEGYDVVITDSELRASRRHGLRVLRAPALSIRRTQLLDSGNEGLDVMGVTRVEAANLLIARSGGRGVRHRDGRRARRRPRGRPTRRSPPASATKASYWHITVVDSGAEGIRHESGSLVLRNSIVARSGREGLRTQQANLLRHEENLFWDNRRGDLLGTRPAPSELFVDPLFTGRRDFHLQTSSPAIDAGVDASATTRLDLESSVRPVGGGFDLGAYESPSRGVDHFAILHDGNGVYCLSEPVTVQAVDAAGNPVLDYTGAVTLDTQSGSGSWIPAGSNQGVFSDPTANDGRASYRFADADDGVARFLLSYPEGGTPIDVDAFETADPALRDDDAEGTLAWSPSGLLVTGSPIPNPPPPLVSSLVGTQTAGAPFPVYLTAYGQTPEDPTCGVIESYAGSRSLRVWVEHRDPGSGPRVPTVDGVPIGIDPSTAPLPITFAAGQAVLNVKYKDVGRIALGLLDDSVTEPTGGIAGASNDFVVRPAELEITDVSRPDGTPNPGAATPTGPVFVGAGEPFTVTVRVLDAESDPVPSFGKESSAEGLKIRASTLVAPAGGRNGTGGAGAILAANAFQPAGPTGTFTGTGFGWDEVGAIRLRASVADGDYLLTGDVEGSESGIVGRFVPSWLDGVPNLPLLATACVAGGYSYVGQPFGFVPGAEPELTFTARNAAGGVTQNYAGAWFRVTASSLQNLAYSAAAGTLTPGAPAAPRIEDRGSGTGAVIFDQGPSLTFTRLAPTAPFDAEIALSFDLRDEDNVLDPANPRSFGWPTAGAGIAWSAGAQMRFGRLAFANAHGSELLPLPVPLRAEYWDGSAFVPHPADQCSALPLADLLLAPSPGTLVTTAQITNVPLAAGDAGLTLSAPGAGQTGTVDLVYDLSSSSGADLTWLLGDWDGDGAFLENPAGRATFGIYAGSDRIIFVRDAY